MKNRRKKSCDIFSIFSNFLPLIYLFFLCDIFSGESPNSRRVLFDYPASPYLYGNYHHPSPSEDLLLWFGSTSAGECTENKYIFIHYP